MAGHQVMDGAEGGHAVPLVFEPALNFAGAPAFMAVMRHAQQGCDVVWRAVRGMVRYARTVLKAGGTFLPPAAKSLVGGRR